MKQYAEQAYKIEKLHV